MMLESYKSAKKYHDEAIAVEDAEVRKTFKELAMNEVIEFDRLSYIYEHKSAPNTGDHDYWLHHFKGEMAELRKQVGEIN